MTIFDSRAARVMMTALAFAVCLGFLWVAWRTFIAFLFAIFFAYLLETPVNYFGRRFRKHPRAIGILITYLILFGALAILLTIFGSRIMQEGQRLSQQLPKLSENFSNGQLVRSMGERRGWSAQTVHHIQGFLEGHRQQIVDSVEK